MPIAREADPEPSRFDRRGFLRRAAIVGGAAAGGGALALAGAAPAEAQTGGAMLIGQTNVPSSPNDPATQLLDPSNNTLSALMLHVNNYTNTYAPLPSARIGIAGNVSGNDVVSLQRIGVYGAADAQGIGVGGSSPTGAGVVGASSGAAMPSAVAQPVGVYGVSGTGIGVQADAHDVQPAVLANALGTGVGVQAIAGGATPPAASGPVGVYGAATGEGSIGVSGFAQIGETAIGVQGIGQQGVGVRAVGLSNAPALAAEGQGSASAVKATYTGNLVGTAPAIDASTVGKGPAVAAVSSNGIGATFKGRVAAVRLIPQSKAGAPTTGHHDAGELIVDSAGQPWLCTKAGVPGTWKQLVLA